MAEIKTQGTEVYILDVTATGNEVRKIGKITGFTGVGGEAGEIDITNLDSAAMEYLTGLQDNGSIGINVNYDPQDASHIDVDSRVGGANVRILIAGSESATQPTFSATYTLPTDRTTLDLVGGFRSFQKDWNTDDVVRGSINVRISGAITITAAS